MSHTCNKVGAKAGADPSQGQPRVAKDIKREATLRRQDEAGPGAGLGAKMLLAGKLKDG